GGGDGGGEDEGGEFAAGDEEVVGGLDQAGDHQSRHGHQQEEADDDAVIEQGHGGPSPPSLPLRCRRSRSRLKMSLNSCIGTTVHTMRITNPTASTVVVIQSIRSSS